MHEIHCKDTGERVIGYKDYLHTKHWIALRDKFSKTQIKECVMCFTDKNLNIHHMTYERLGNEDFNDLVYLCKDCHNKLHGALGTTKSKYLLSLRTNKKKSKRPQKPVKRCQTCIDYFKGVCLLGYKNKDHKCEHYKLNPKKKPLITDEYTNFKKVGAKQPKPKK